jgi:hypothetical protein
MGYLSDDEWQKPNGGTHGPLRRNEIVHRGSFQWVAVPRTGAKAKAKGMSRKIPVEFRSNV